MTIQIADISFYQSSLDAKVMKKLLHGVILRSGQGTWEDREFKTFRDEARREGLPYGSYWYLDNDHSPKVQAQKWADILGGDQPPLGCWIDLEDTLPGVYSGWRYWYDAIEYFKQYHKPEKFGIYTRASYFDPIVPQSQYSYFGKHDLWVAHYYVGKPAIPKAWKEWLFWQWTERGDGHLHGVGSHRIDLNHFNGTEDDFRKRFGISNSQMRAHFGGTQVTYRQE